MAWLVRWSKAQSRKTTFVPRVVIGGLLLAALAISADAAFGSPLTIGPGIEAMEWVVSPENGLGLIALLFGLRISATLVTLAAGGVGGLFIPLAAQGVILGKEHLQLQVKFVLFLHQPVALFPEFRAVAHRKPTVGVSFHLPHGKHSLPIGRF